MTIANTLIKFVPSQVDPLEKGCGTQNIPILIPREITDDRYFIRFDIEYHVNPIKNKEIVTFSTEDFNIIGMNGRHEAVKP